MRPATARTAARTKRLRLPGWPTGLDGLRLAVLVDLHAGAGGMDETSLRAVVEAANRAKPHLVVLLGDFVDANAAPEEHGEAEEVAAALAGLRAPLGVFGLLGNHDRARSGAQTVTTLEHAGVTVLENRALRAGGLWLAGISDAAGARPGPERALAAVPEDAPVVAITHSPDVFPMVPDRVALTVHPGIGTSRLPVRLRATPQVTILELRRRRGTHYPAR